MAGRVFAWALAHIKVTIIVLGVLLTSVVRPGMVALWNLFMDSTDSSAMTKILVKENDLRKLKDIEQDTNMSVVSSLLQEIKDSQIRAEERVYKELQTARQQRLANP